MVVDVTLHQVVVFVSRLVRRPECVVRVSVTMGEGRRVVYRNRGAVTMVANSLEERCAPTRVTVGVEGEEPGWRNATAWLNPANCFNRRRKLLAMAEDDGKLSINLIKGQFKSDKLWLTCLNNISIGGEGRGDVAFQFVDGSNATVLVAAEEIQDRKLVVSYMFDGWIEKKMVQVNRAQQENRITVFKIKRTFTVQGVKF